MNITKYKSAVTATTVLLILLFGTAISAQTNEEKSARAAKILEEGKELIGEGTTESYQAAKEKLRSAAKLFASIGNKDSEAEALVGLGVVLDRLGEKIAALESFKQVLPVIRLSDDAEGKVYVFNALGKVYRETGDNQQALKIFDEAYSLIGALEDESLKALTLSNIGSTYSALSDNQKALKFFREALPFVLNAEDEEGKAFIYSNLGLAHLGLGEMKEALDYFNKALPILSATGNKAVEATVLSNIGLIYFNLGDNRQALEFFNKSIPLAQSFGDKNIEATTLINIGGVYLDLGDNTRAVEYSTKALALFRAVNNKLGEARALNNLGTIYLDAEDYPQALKFFNESLPVARIVGDQSATAVTLSNIGGAYSKLGDNRQALKFFNEALPIAKSIGDKTTEAALLANLMFVWENQKVPRLAIFYGKESINLFQQQRQNITSLDKETQKIYLKKIEEAYRLLADILIADGRLAEAQQILNLFKDQQFFDFNRNPDEPVKRLSQTPRETEFSARYNKLSDRLTRAAITLDEAKRSIENRQPRADESARLRKLEDELKIISDEFLAVLKQSEAEFSKPAETDDKISVVPDLIEMQKSLADLNLQTGQKIAAVYTLVSENNFRALVITPDAVKAVSSPVKAENLNALALRYWKILQSAKYDPLPISKQVYDVVFKAIEAELPKETTTIMWSLDGNLRYLPMAALFDGRQYLVERYSHVNFTRADQERMTRDVQPNWTGTGFGSSAAHTVKLLGETLQFPALPGVSRELQQIFKQPNLKTGILGGKVLADDEFTKTGFSEALKTRRPVVHIASHFAFRPGDESRSFLLLGDGSTLTLNEMKKQNTLFAGVDLLALSACETAAARADADGREVDGLAELAQRLGASAVIASLWQVADESTAQLMSEFYRLKTASPQTTKAEAMRQVQLSMLKGEQKIKRTREKRSDLASSAAGDGEGSAPFAYDETKPFAHPYYWSPFVLIGNWR